jgi:hypothetical protein
MDEDEENYDLIAPVTQNTEHQDICEGTQDLHPDLNENYDLVVILEFLQLSLGDIK